MGAFQNWLKGKPKASKNYNRLTSNQKRKVRQAWEKNPKSVGETIQGFLGGNENIVVGDTNTGGETFTPPEEVSDAINNAPVDVDNINTYTPTKTDGSEGPPGSYTPGEEAGGGEVAEEEGESTLDKDAVASTEELLRRAKEYGDRIAGEYLPEGTFGTISAETTPEMQAWLDRLNLWAERAGQYTDYEQKTLDLMEASLAGYAAPEVQAMREGAMQEINRGYSTALAEQRIAQSRGGVRGAASGAQMQDLQLGRMESVGNLERDLLIENAREVQRRKEAFADLVRQTEDARFGRQEAAESTYGSALTYEDASRSSKELFNVNQATNEQLARGGLALSAAGTYAGMQQGMEATNTQNAWLEYLKEKDVSDRDFMDTMSKRYWKNTRRLTSEAWDQAQ